MTSEPKLSPRQSEYRRAHTESEQIAQRILSEMRVPYVSSYKYPRQEWRCQKCGKRYENYELARKHYNIPEHFVEEMFFEVDLLIGDRDAIEIIGAGTSSFDEKRQEFFKTNFPILKFHYFPNFILQKYPEVFQAYVELLMELRAK